jgi:hypothetical protein
MNEDVERQLRQVTPRGAPPELRSRVLAAVADQLRLATPLPSRRRPFRPALAVAASLVVSLALNYWVNDTIDRRLAIVLGPPPVPKQAAEIADEIAAITDPATGRWAYEQLAASRPRDDDARQYAVRLQQMIQQLTVDMKETANEATQKNPHMGRDRSGSCDRLPADAQCVLRLEHQYTACAPAR